VVVLVITSSLGYPMFAQQMKPVFAIAAHVNVGPSKVSDKPVSRGIPAKMVSVLLPKILWLALCLLNGDPAHATTVIAVVEGTSVYIGTDSQTVPSGTICKLVASERFAVGMAGHLADSSTTFSAARSVMLGLAKARSLQAAIDSVIDSLEPPLKRSLEWGFKNSPDDYAQELQHGPLVLSLLVIGIEKGRPQIVVLSWTSEKGDMVRQPVRRYGEKGAYDAIGSFDPFVPYLLAHRGEWESWEPVERIRKALQVISVATPEIVGPPFSILQISPARGVKWIERGPCETEKHREHHEGGQP
jgi:hypothetical protein